MNVDPRTQAVLYRFLLVLLVTDAPIVSAALLAPTFDWRYLAAGLITGALAAAEKVFSPQVANVILPGTAITATMAPPVSSTAANPAIVSFVQAGPSASSLPRIPQTQHPRTGTPSGPANPPRELHR
jgi:spore maturation protein SpmB